MVRRRAGIASVLAAAAVAASSFVAPSAHAEGPLGGLLGGLTGASSGSAQGNLTDTLNETLNSVTNTVGLDVELDTEDSIALDVELEETNGLLGLDLAVDVSNEGAALGAAAEVLGEVALDTQVEALTPETLLDIATDASTGSLLGEPIEVGVDTGVGPGGITLDVTAPNIEVGAGLDESGLGVDLGAGDTEIGLGVSPDTGLDVTLPELPGLPVVPVLPTTPTETPVLTDAGAEGDIAFDPQGPVFSAEPLDAPRPAPVAQTQSVEGTTSGSTATSAAAAGGAVFRLEAGGDVAASTLLQDAALQGAGAEEASSRSLTNNRLVNAWRAAVVGLDGTSIGSGVGGWTAHAIAVAMTAFLGGLLVLQTATPSTRRLASFTHQTLVPPG